MPIHSPHLAYIQDIEEYLAVIDERLQQAVKKAIKSNNIRDADAIAQIQELATDLHIAVFKFLTTTTRSTHHLPITPVAHTPIGYRWEPSTEETIEDGEDVNTRETLIPDK